MTPQEAADLRRFDRPCTCGGFAASMNGRDPRHPHMSWCPQLPQWEAWRRAMDLYQARKGEGEE
jgi:hypothetical protein